MGERKIKFQKIKKNSKSDVFLFKKLVEEDD
jgi:hypothetical protein